MLIGLPQAVLAVSLLAADGSPLQYTMWAVFLVLLAIALPRHLPPRGAGGT